RRLSSAARRLYGLRVPHRPPVPGLWLLHEPEGPTAPRTLPPRQMAFGPRRASGDRPDGRHTEGERRFGRPRSKPPFVRRTDPAGSVRPSPGAHHTNTFEDSARGGKHGRIRTAAHPRVAHEGDQPEAPASEFRNTLAGASGWLKTDPSPKALCAH